MVKMNRKEKLLEELRNSLGLRTTACNKVGVSTHTFYNWLNSDPAFAARVHDIDEEMVDTVEAYLYKLIKAGNPASIIFYLKCRGKHRGYVERVETKELSASEMQHVTFVFKRFEEKSAVSTPVLNDDRVTFANPKVTPTEDSMEEEEDAVLEEIP